MSFTTLFFDLDDTLYANDNGLWEAIRDRMSEYMHERLSLSRHAIPELRRHYYETYGTTMRGLQIHYNVDADDYLAYVHDLTLDAFLQPDPELRDLLLSLTQRKWIFTNADADHTHRVVIILGLVNCFEGIIDVRAIDFHCKPEVEAYQLAMDMAGETDPRRCILVDDSPRNLAPARSLGFTTILVGPNGAHPAAHYNITRIHDLSQAMPDLWQID